MPIRILPEEVALKIAAGEVVTRPADAVKELVENAIDACLPASDPVIAPPNPPRIEVEIRGGGLSLIRVVDTGRGILADEVELAFQRHATSKLASAEDLLSVRTLGFRGEALASIAAVSQVVVYTRPADADLGCLLSLEAGRVVERSVRGGPVGTSLTVRNLFQNVPARLRFLRTATGEAGQIAHLVGQYAMAYPGIRFSLLNEGRLAFQSPGSGRLLDVLAKVYDAGLAAKLLPIEAEAGRVRLTGYVSEPNTTRSTRGAISLFVNRRLIQSRALTYAIEEAYQPSLPAGRHPIAVLCLEVPTSEVDVNVHPTKAEVRFVDERALYSAIRRVVREAILGRAPIPAIAAPLAPALPLGMPDSAASTPAAWPSDDLEQRSFPSDLPEPAPMAPVGDEETAEEPSSRPNGLPILHPLGQVQRTYIVAEGPDGVYFVDQHTAHERVRYEEIQSQRAAVASQELLEPLVIELTPRQWELLGEGASSLRALGFAFEVFGERSCLLRAVPAMLRRDEPGRAFGDVVEALALEQPAEGVDAAAAVLACHSAVRAGDALSPQEIRELLGRLEGLDVWRYCPHGRPIVVRLDAAQLARDFRRI